MKRLPVGIQTFREVIEGGYVYADKTGFIRELLEQGRYFFLSRPRRFGKSLFVDTLREAFLGRRELFAGLDLAASDFDFTPRPVVRLDLSGVDASTPEILRQDVMELLGDVARAAGIEPSGQSPATILRRLITQLHREAGHRVVVLIDEYDKPITDHLDDPRVAEANREVLGYLYGVLKSIDADLRFVFLTGVSRFTRLSVFSQLNNLIDISLDPLFAAVCGFTCDEFDSLFSDHLAGIVESRTRRGLPELAADTARQEIFGWYDGYSWDGRTRVFNPFSLLNFFREGQFYPFWYSSGVPRFLAGHLRDRPGMYAAVQEADVTELDLDSHGIEQASLESLLFQTGFLTVKSVDVSRLPALYRLGFPNREVSQSLSAGFLTAVSGSAAETQTWSHRIADAFEAGRLDGVEGLLAGLFASIPYNLHVPREAFYHAVFLAAAQSVGLRMTPEAAVAGGEVDGTIDTATGRSYVVEMKYAALPDGATRGTTSRTLDRITCDALAQIDQNGYADVYQGTGREVYKVGIGVVGRGIVRLRWAR